MGLCQHYVRFAAGLAAAEWRKPALKPGRDLVYDEVPTQPRLKFALTRFSLRIEALTHLLLLLVRRAPVAALSASAALLVAAASTTTLAAEPASPAVAPADAACQSLLADLDSPKFVTRERAYARLCRMLDNPAQGQALGAAVHRAWLSDDTSVDLRAQLQALLAQYPQLAPPEPPSNLSVDEIGVLVEQLNADAEQTRAAALARIRWHLRDAQVATRALQPLKAALASPEMSAGGRERIKPLLQLARSRWLPDPKLDCQLPVIAETDIQGWIARVAEPNPASVADRARQDAAREELLDLLARDPCAARVAQLLERAKDTAGDANAADRLQELFDWTRPALAAECWEDGHHRTLQHLLVGVPQIPEGSARATFFDRIDDRQAHCVSGNSLVPGDYSVGVAIPHPEGAERIFRLLNLPTPRRRMAFEIEAVRSERERFVEMSRCTVEAIVEDKRHLREVDIVMLSQLDPETVSAVADKYFEAVPDQSLGQAEYASGPYLGPGQRTEHDAVCYVLAKIGTHTAQAALEREAARRQLDPDAMPLAQLALLAIAQRDPWPEVDAWLADLVAKEQPFVISPGQKADLGATAAALLLSRHGVPAEWYELEALDSATLESLGITPHRFKQPEKRAEVLRWWRDNRTNRQTAKAGI